MESDGAGAAFPRALTSIPLTRSHWSCNLNNGKEKIWGGEFQARGTANPKALRMDRAWHVWWKDQIRNIVSKRKSGGTEGGEAGGRQSAPYWL